MKIKTGDTVLIIAGKDKGRKGKVLRALPQKGRILVEGINIHKKHAKPRRGGQKGQIMEIPASIAVSSAKIVCAKCGKAARVGYKLEGPKKYRVCKECNSEL